MLRNLSKLTIAYIVLVIVVSILLVFAIVNLAAGDDKKTDPKAKQTTSAKQDTAQKDKPATTPKPEPATPKKPTASAPKPTTTTPTPTPAPSPAPNTGSQKLANSGPGDVIALFVGTLLLAAAVCNRLQAARI